MAAETATFNSVAGVAMAATIIIGNSSTTSSTTTIMMETRSCSRATGDWAFLHSPRSAAVVLILIQRLC
jgi:hypothetical protein